LSASAETLSFARRIRRLRLRRSGRSLFLALLAIALGCLNGFAQNAMPAAPSAADAPFSAANLARFGYFYVGGHYAGPAGKEVMDGAMYTEVLVPKKIQHKFPLVLYHGLGQTATNWWQTPDGREGWAQYFIDQGYVVYMVDQPARGRSPYHPEIDGPLRTFAAHDVEQRFTDETELGNWPQAKNQTQWPGSGPKKGRMGDPVFEAFYATQVDSLVSDIETQKRVQAASAALLDKIGPAVILTHSQAGAFGWLIADARPKLVKGIVAIEPAGPPFENLIPPVGPVRPWGLTDIPLTYEPAVSDPSELKTVKQEKPDGPDQAACYRQQEPARKLPNLASVPVVVVASEASYHASYDHCTAQYLSQAGVKATYVHLPDRGIHGNGHMMMLEKNNLEIAKLVDQWIQKNVH
jgi:pimeloyl-ACP methyl ester carboxylesterase